MKWYTAKDAEKVSNTWNKNNQHQQTHCQKQDAKTPMQNTKKKFPFNMTGI